MDSTKTTPLLMLGRYPGVRDAAGLFESRLLLELESGEADVNRWKVE